MNEQGPVIPRHHRRRAKIKLACGCSVLFRDGPLSDHQKYACPSQVGHGYSLAWVEWAFPEDTRPTVNKNRPMPTTKGRKLR